MRKVFAIFAFWLSFLLLGFALAQAEPSPGILQGTVLSAKGKPVAAARVFVQTADGSAPRAVRTDAEGHFRTPALNAGLYDVRAEAAGTWSSWAHNVVLKSGTKANLTLRLMRSSPPPAHQ